MAARSGSWSARLGPGSGPPVPAPWPHSTSGTCRDGPELQHASAAWHPRFHITRGSGGEARGGRGNGRFFKIEMDKFKKKRRSLGMERAPGPVGGVGCGWWRREGRARPPPEKLVPLPSCGACVSWTSPWRIRGCCPDEIPVKSGEGLCHRGAGAGQPFAAPACLVPQEFWGGGTWERSAGLRSRLRGAGGSLALGGPHGPPSLLPPLKRL